MTSKEMWKAKCQPGYWFRNVAPNGSKPNWRIEVMPAPASTALFGYNRDEFMAKQYRTCGAMRGQK